MGKRFVAVARVGRPHGVSGEVRLDPLGGLPRGLSGYTRFYLGRPGAVGDAELEPVGLDSHRAHGRFLLAKFAGLETPEDARALLHATLYVERGEMPPLEEGEYYHVDLLGCRIVDEAGNDLGGVVDVFSTAAHDVLVVGEGAREWMLPVIEDVVLSLDPDEQKIAVRPPAGLRA